jgi:hypothetical protein
MGRAKDFALDTHAKYASEHFRTNALTKSTGLNVRGNVHTSVKLVVGDSVLDKHSQNTATIIVQKPKKNKLVFSLFELNQIFLTDIDPLITTPYLFFSQH